ncbi:myb-like dna-binding [Plasmopara halstedii]|uniref:Myb-like dna-binding n=1 Tax=Plasmopara halstedii TaxID=4781 RepID=A0A0P1ABA6_PLAHL|nr:myb-like dna-binding [Plasmopara halstedii]CEG38114.1 myb-like dna-binding [Plasmopara halstedii]|eukprot:XP_024574483.1 myb-like dna-binding [Plasmopara halstedii]
MLYISLKFDRFLAVPVAVCLDWRSTTKANSPLNLNLVHATAPDVDVLSKMTISANVRKELFEMTSSEGKLIRIKPTEAKAGTTVYSSKQSQPLKLWTEEEHEKFLEAMEKYPAGPWKVIAAFIGTKTTRQTMTHAQKYRQKISRWRRGLRHKGRKQAGDDSMQHNEAELQDYSAKENLFKAIEYVSGDEMAVQYGRVNTNGNLSVSPTRSLTGVPGHEAPRSELFRLAEIASVEGMKQEPVPVPCSSFMPSSPPDVEMADMSASPVVIKQCPKEIVARASVEFSEKIRKMEWGNNRRTSPEWCTQNADVRLSPLRVSPDGTPFPIRKFGGVLSAITEMSYQNAQNRLPLPPSSALILSPMRITGAEERKMEQQAPCGNSVFRLPPLNVVSTQSLSVFSIPPLRSKIDPSEMVDMWNEGKMDETNRRRVVKSSVSSGISADEKINEKSMRKRIKDEDKTTAGRANEWDHHSKVPRRCYLLDCGHDGVGVVDAKPRVMSSHADCNWL